MVSKKTKMLAPLRSCMLKCLFTFVRCWGMTPIVWLGRQQREGGRERECWINVSFNQAQSSASNYDSVKISTQLLAHCLAQNFRTYISSKLSTFLYLKMWFLRFWSSLRSVCKNVFKMVARIGRKMSF